jgi:hypothetical protein
LFLSAMFPIDGPFNCFCCCCSAILICAFTCLEGR